MEKAAILFFFSAGLMPFAVLLTRLKLKDKSRNNLYPISLLILFGFFTQVYMYRNTYNENSVNNRIWDSSPVEKFLMPAVYSFSLNNNAILLYLVIYSIVFLTIYYFSRIKDKKMDILESSY